MIYDSNAITGNESLDILLTEKRLKCNSDGIVFSCIADGKLLNFLRPSEISVFFGNALDNSIEAECKEDAEKRRIVLNVAKKNDMITISIENYFSGGSRKRRQRGTFNDERRQKGTRIRHEKHEADCGKIQRKYAVFYKKGTFLSQSDLQSIKIKIFSPPVKGDVFPFVKSFLLLAKTYIDGKGLR